MVVLSRPVRSRIWSSVVGLICLCACSKPESPPQIAADTTIPAGPFGDAARRGRAMLLATRDSLPSHVGNGLRCTSCHLDAGRRESGTWIGVHARYPQYRARSGVVETIEYRVNDCFRRSMNGTALDPASAEMRDIVAYFAFLSRGTQVGQPAGSPGARLQRWAAFKADTGAGASIFGASCAKCHGAQGEGTAV